MRLFITLFILFSLLFLEAISATATDVDDIVTNDHLFFFSEYISLKELSSLLIACLSLILTYMLYRFSKKGDVFNKIEELYVRSNHTVSQKTCEEYRNLLNKEMANNHSAHIKDISTIVNDPSKSLSHSFDAQGSLLAVQIKLQNIFYKQIITKTKTNKKYSEIFDDHNNINCCIQDLLSNDSTKQFSGIGSLIAYTREGLVPKEIIGLITLLQKSNRLHGHTEQIAQLKRELTQNGFNSNMKN